MPSTHAEACQSADFHAEYQSKRAMEAASLLRGLDDKVRAAVLKHYRDADLPGSQRRITAAVLDYRERLVKTIAGFR